MEIDREFLDRLSDALRAGARDLAAEVVLVGSNRLGRELGERLRARNGGWANLRFLTPIDLARVLQEGEGIAADRRPLLTRPGKLALAREALRLSSSSPSPFGALAGRPGFAAALAETFDDAIESGLDELPASILGTASGRELEILYRSWRALLSELARHPAEVLAGAAASAGRFRGVFGGERLWLAGFYELTPSQWTLLESVSRAGVKLIASLPFPGGPRGEFVRRLRERLLALGGETLDPPAADAASPAAGGDLERFQAAILRSEPAAAAGPASRDGSLRVISSPDEEREVREAARWAISLFLERGIPFHRMAFTFPRASREIYGPLAEEIFPPAGVPLDRSGPGNSLGTGLRTLANSFEGRAVRLLLELAGSASPPRSRLLDLLSFAESPLPIDLHRLGRLSRLGGIVAWSGDWKDRLAFAARLLRSPASDEEEAGGDPDLPRLCQESFPRLEEILAGLAAFPRRGSWDRLAASLASLLEILRFPRGEGSATGRILRQLAALAPLEAETTREAFRASMEEELRRAPSPGGERTDGGVIVGDLLELRGLRFEALAIAGLIEGAFPAVPRGDPLLPDGARALLQRDPRVAGRLPLKGARAAEEALIFAGAVLSTGGALLLSYPRLDPMSGRSRLPSIFLRESLAFLTGKSPTQKEIDAEPPPKGLERLRLSHGSLDPIRSLTPGELRLAAAARAASSQWPRRAVEEALFRRDPSLARLARFEEGKWGARLDAADGLVRPDLLSLLRGTRIAGAAAPISVTRLETFSLCPRKYFYRYALGLEEDEEPETIHELRAIDRGLIGHQILERTYRSLRDRGLLPLRPERLLEASALLDRVCDETFAERERSLPVGLPLLWELVGNRLREELRGFLEREAIDEEHRALTPFDFEASFGKNGGPSVSLAIPALATLALATPTLAGARADGTAGEAPSRETGAGGALRLRGRIDRIDYDPEGGRFRVLDYKFRGKLPDRPFTGGGSLQLPLYLLAGLEILRARGLGRASIEESSAAYVLPDGKTQEMTGSGWSETLATLARVAATVAGEIEAGHFFAIPGANRKNCRYCPYDPICDPRIESMAARKGAALGGALHRLKASLDEAPAAGGRRKR